MEEKAHQVAELLKVLANEQRLLILCALIEEKMSVTDLMSHTPTLSQSALSQHLALLRAHNIVQGEKSGLNVIYSISDPRIIEVLSVLKHHYCT